MRKIIVLSFITLDGVMQAPGGPEEDTSSGFKYGGWTAPYFTKADEAAGEKMRLTIGAATNIRTTRRISGKTISRPLS